MRIYRYLFREISSNFFAVSLVLLLIFFSGRFVKYLSEVAAGAISSKVLFSILLYRMPAFMELILPLALFIGVMLGYGRLYVESEMIVMQSCGVSKRRLLFYTLGPATLVMLLVAMFTLYLTPLGWKKFHEIWNDPATYSGLGTIVPGSFKKFAGQNMIVYSASMNNQKTELQDIFAVKSSHDPNDHTLAIVKAKRAEIVTSANGDPFIQLFEGNLYSGQPGLLEFSMTKFKKYGQRIREPEAASEGDGSIDGLTTAFLWGSENNKEKAALGWRISLPFIVPIVALIALALSETTHRKGRYGKLLPGFILYIVYLALLLGIRTEIEKGRIVYIEAYFLVHLLFVLIGFLLLYWNQLSLWMSYRSRVKL